MTGLYIHIPFCAFKCFYCSFVVAVAKEGRVDEYLQCLDKEANLYRGERISTVYVGGGTPSVLRADQIDVLFASVRKHFRVDPNAEVTFEMNPESTDDNVISALSAHGVTRVSLGVQSLNDRLLEYLGRRHTASQARGAYQRLRKRGRFDVSVDMMFGFDGQTLDQVRSDLYGFLDWDPDHISLYQLGIEKNSRFYTRSVLPAVEDEQVRFYEWISSRLADSGFEQYEISNFARPGKASRHNLSYWEGKDYIGIGVGAHSFYRGERFHNSDRLRTYLENIRTSGTDTRDHRRLAPYDQFKELVLLGLRMTRGVHWPSLSERYGTTFSEADHVFLEDLREEGLLTEEDGMLMVTPKGRLLIDEISSRFL